MPDTLVDNGSAFPDVPAPLNSDAISTVDIRRGLQALANRTRYVLETFGNVAFAFARLDGLGKLSPIYVHNGFIDGFLLKRTSNWTDTDKATTNTSFQDCVGLVGGLGFCVVGDVFDILAVVHAGLDSTTHPGEYIITIIEGDGSTVDLAETRYRVLNDGFSPGVQGQIVLSTQYTIAHAGTVTVKVRLRSTDGGGNVYQFGPSTLKCNHYRP